LCSEEGNVQFFERNLKMIEKWRHRQNFRSSVSSSGWLKALSDVHKMTEEEYKEYMHAKNAKQIEEGNAPIMQIPDGDIKPTLTETYDRVGIELS
jgi:hypothetical protein